MRRNFHPRHTSSRRRKLKYFSNYSSSLRCFFCSSSSVTTGETISNPTFFQFHNSVMKPQLSKDSLSFHSFPGWKGEQRTMMRTASFFQRYVLQVRGTSLNVVVANKRCFEVEAKETWTARLSLRHDLMLWKHKVLIIQLVCTRL